MMMCALLCSVWLTLIVAEDLVCPDDSQQIGVLNAAVSSQLSSRTDLSSIDECEQQCNNNVACVAFSWAAVGGNGAVGFADTTACILHDSIVPDTTQGPNTVLCRAACELAFTNEVSAYLSGDPHFYTFNGVRHHFQGEQDWNGESYYLMTGCDTNDVTTMPWRLSMTVKPYGYSGPTIVDYITLEMHQNDGAVYYMWFSSDASLLKVAEVPRGTTHNFDDVSDMADVTLTGYTSAGWTSPSGKFVVEAAGAGGSSISVTLTVVGQELDDGSTQDCESTFYIQYQGMWNGNRYHYVRAEPPSCYKCSTCGLFGDFQHSWGVTQMSKCDGSDFTFSTSLDSAVWDPTGWSWDVANVNDNCMGHIDAVPKAEVEDCSDDVRAAATLQCAQAHAAYDLCCLKIGTEGFCQSLEEACEIDVCISAGDDLSLVAGLVESEFNQVLETECQHEAWSAAPKLLYEFDDDLKETMSDGDDAYELTCTGQARVDHGVLLCDEQGDAASSPSLSLALAGHSLELLVRISDLDTGGTIMSIEMGDKHEAIAYNIVIDNNRFNRKMTLSSDLFFASDDSEKFYNQDTWTEEDSDSDVIHFVATFDKDANKMQLYRDAQAELHFAPTSWIDRIDEQWNLDLCALVEDEKGIKTPFQGSILYAAFYEKALSADEVVALYQSKLPSWLGNVIEAIGDELLPGRSLNTGQALVSANGLYAAVVENGNFFIKQSPESAIIRDYGLTNVDYVKYESDGSITAYDNEGILTVICESIDDASVLIMTGEGVLQAFTSSETPTVYYDSSSEGSSAQALAISVLDDNSDIELKRPVEPLGVHERPVQPMTKRVRPVRPVRPVTPAQPVQPVGPLNPLEVPVSVTAATTNNVFILALVFLIVNAACLGWTLYERKFNKQKGYKVVSFASGTDMDV